MNVQSFRIATMAACMTFGLSSAYATPYSMGRSMGHTEGKDTPKGLIMFSTLQAANTPYTATYDTTVENAQAGITSTENLKERQQKLLAIGPMFGIHLPLNKRLRLTVGVGVSALSIDEELLGNESGGEGGESSPRTSVVNEFVSYDLNPGVSILAGIDWEPIRYKRVSIMTGLKASLMTASGLKGYEFSSAGTEEANTTDVSLNIISINPHIGMEWRPYQSFATNNFGLFGNVVFSAATFTQSNVGDGRNLTKEIAFSVEPEQYLGAYYGWSFAIPHFGTLGAEVQVGAVLSGALNYQYEF